ACLPKQKNTIEPVIGALCRQELRWRFSAASGSLGRAFWRKMADRRGAKRMMNRSRASLHPVGRLGRESNEDEHVVEGDRLGPDAGDAPAAVLGVGAGADFDLDHQGQ